MPLSNWTLKRLSESKQLNVEELSVDALANSRDRNNFYALCEKSDA